jgi:uncharacterized membrane protein
MLVYSSSIYKTIQQILQFMCQCILKSKKQFANGASVYRVYQERLQKRTTEERKGNITMMVLVKVEVFYKK